MNLYFNPRSAILLAVFVQAVVTAFLVLQRRQKSNTQSDKFLSALLFFLGFSLTDFVIGFLGFYDKFPRLTFFPFENLFAITALLYLFCLSLLQNDKPSKKAVQKHLTCRPSIFRTGDGSTERDRHTNGTQKRLSEVFVLSDLFGDGAGCVGFSGPDSPLKLPLAQLD